MKLLIYLSILSCFSFQHTSAATDKVLCYYEGGSANFFAPDDIDVNICTHINYAFLGVHENGSLRLDGTDEVIKKVSALKSKNADLKLIFSVGGWGEDPRGFSHVAESAERKAEMAESALWYLKTYNFDGIDIDWEYPGRRGGTPADNANFVDMLSVLRKKFDESGGFLLTTAVCFYVECGEYNVSAISKYRMTFSSNIVVLFRNHFLKYINNEEVLISSVKVQKHVNGLVTSIRDYRALRWHL